VTPSVAAPGDTNPSDATVEVSVKTSTSRCYTHTIEMCASSNNRLIDDGKNLDVNQ